MVPAEVICGVCFVGKGILWRAHCEIKPILAQLSPEKHAKPVFT
tara:strand:- start:26 stop:157 length:132 start_codon:yes stop_codon:yes gene_type:complete